MIVSYDDVVIEVDSIDYTFLETKTCAYLVGYITDKTTLLIESFYSKERGKRTGSRVLLNTIRFVLKNHQDIKRVTLDDSTGINPPKNIYYRLGFQVRDENDECFINWDAWLKRYSHEIPNPSEERMINIDKLFQNLKLFHDFQQEEQ